MKKINYLKAVFWDYPDLTDEDTLKSLLRTKSESDIYYWVMGRFLEHGRVVDTFRYFKIEEIVKSLPKLNITPYTARKWKRLIEVYGRF